MMSVFTIKWHLIFRSLAEESAQFRNTESFCKIIAEGETWSLPQRWEINLSFCQLSPDVYSFNENLTYL